MELAFNIFHNFERENGVFLKSSDDTVKTRT